MYSHLIMRLLNYWESNTFISLIGLTHVVKAVKCRDNAKQSQIITYKCRLNHVKYLVTKANTNTTKMSKPITLTYSFYGTTWNCSLKKVHNTPHLNDKNNCLISNCIDSQSSLTNTSLMCFSCHSQAQASLLSKHVFKIKGYTTDIVLIISSLSEDLVKE